MSLVEEVLVSELEIEQFARLSLAIKDVSEIENAPELLVAFESVLRRARLSVRQATELQNAQAVVEAARKPMREIGCGCEPGNGYYTPEGVREWLDEPSYCEFHAALARYDEGRQA